MTSLELAKYIETLRKRRSIDIDDFTKDIVSVRQYRRYLTGNSEMPYRIFILLSNKLGFNPVKIQGDLYDEIAAQNEQIEKLYNYIVSKNFKEADKILETNDFTTFLDDSLEMYYQVTMVVYEYFKDNTSVEECEKKLYEIIDYPNILKKDLFEQVELLVLSLLLMFINETDKPQLLKKLSDQLLREKITLGNDIYSKLYVTLRVAREYGIKKDNHQVIKLCNRALELSDRPKIHFNYDFFYYYLALSYRNLKDEENKFKYVKKLHNYLMFIDDEYKTTKYTSKFMKDFNIKIEDLK